jgi:hypothetical protein
MIVLITIKLNLLSNVNYDMFSDLNKHYFNGEIKKKHSCFELLLLFTLNIIIVYVNCIYNAKTCLPWKNA